MDGRVKKGRSTRQHVVEAAAALFARDGYEATSIEAVLERSGVSRGALYHHFADKRALFEAVLVRVHKETIDKALASAEGAADGLEALRAGSKAWIRLARDSKVRRIVLIDAPAVVGWDRWRQIDEEHGFGVVKAGLAAAAERKLIAPRLIDATAHMLLAVLNELALLVATSADPVRAEREALAALDHLLKRLLAEA